MVSKSKTMPDITSPEEKVPSRTEITRSLQLKDPSWFRQTEDRGVSSPAYRRTPAGQTMDATSIWSRTRLPGMAGDVTERAGRELSSPPESVRSFSPSREIFARDSINLAYNYSTNTSLSAAPLTKMGFQREIVSPEPTSTYISSQPEHTLLERNPAMSPSQGRIASDGPERPVSPTKGLGGFVQSAMMKRSDSVQKRWSAQANTGLSRENSVVSRSGFGRAGSVPTISGAPSSPSKLESRTHINSQRSSVEPELGAEVQRSNGELDKKRLSSPNDQTSDDGPSEQIARATHNQSESTTNVEDDGQREAGISKQLLMTPPTSPSKGAEPKRWSPSKASWLESALNKAPESPEVKSPTIQQPSWMSAISKARQQDTTPDHGSGRVFQEVKTGGLMRAPPAGLPTRSLAFSTPNQSSSTSTGNYRTPQSDDTQQRSETRLRSPPSLAKSPKLTSKVLPANESPEKSVPSEPAEQKLGGSSTSTETPLVGPSIEAELPAATTIKPHIVATKSKPPTPPKKDFRSVLRSRQAIDNKVQQEEPEFKNVFGKLRRTTTQKYVAPNELKDNILRGKAGLCVTGGSIKSERKDELKESLLKQKEALKTKANVQKPQTPPKPSSTATSTKSQTANVVGESAKNVDNATISVDPSAGEKEGPEPSAAATKPENADKSRSDLVTKQITPSLPTSNKEPLSNSSVANKFNARLAQMIARGPPPLANKDEGIAQATSTTQQPFSSVDNNKPPGTFGSSGPLTHMTKNRARGPKRRPPVSNKDDGKRIVSSSIVGHSVALVGDKFKLPVSSPEHLELQPSPSLDRAADGEKLTAQNGGLKEPNAQSVSADIVQDPSIDPVLPMSSELEVSVTVRRTIQPTNVDLSRPLQPSANQGTASAKTSNGDNVTRDSHLNKLTTASPPLGAQLESVSRMGIQLSSQPIEEHARLGLNKYTTNSASQAVAESEEATSSNSKPVTSTTAEACSPEVLSARSLIADFFGDVSKPPSTVPVDIQGILSARAVAISTAKTIRKQIWEITGDGKEQQIPSHQEHILFEDKMYICTHFFVTPEGSKHIEVYLWAGDDISDAAVEDAQLFARKIARENDSKLIKLRQGRESATFFQALGGIIVTRRGPSSRVDSNTPYILCGRRHLGHIAFDEADFSLDSLCSGFSYIISAPPRKTYLWKGKGSATDELGCARLIAMDVGLAVDLEEVDEGKEPTAFLDVFKRESERSIPESADYWGLKPSHDGYCARLYRIDHQAESKVRLLFWSRRQSAENLYRAQVSEIRPFCQLDLDPSHIYCLDAFFEIYV